jgi:aspartate-semialdehyde dehydrogenase
VAASVTLGTERVNALGGHGEDSETNRGESVSQRRLNVGIVGATGFVGDVMKLELKKRQFPIARLRLFASARSAGQWIEWADEKINVEDAAAADYRGLDIVLMSAGSEASRVLAPRIVDHGAIVIDNSSAWRLDVDVPLVVAAANPQALAAIPKGIVANPNCTTMVAMPILKPLHDAAGLQRVVVSTYQAVSGAGGKGIAELAEQISEVALGSDRLAMSADEVQFPPHKVFPAPIAFNIVPLAGKLLDDGETDEEHKFRDESRKILNIANLRVSATCVRVPVYSGHSLSLNLEFKRYLSPNDAVEILRQAPAVELEALPTPLRATGTERSHVGRIRSDPSAENGLALFVTGDNKLMGAALNAVEIAERLLSRFS